MAFNPDGLSLLVEDLSGQDARIYAYRTTDSPASVLDAGYFTGVDDHGFAPGTTVFVIYSDGTSDRINVTAVDADGVATVAGAVGTGVVARVNNQTPDAAGNVTLTAEHIDETEDRFWAAEAGATGPETGAGIIAKINDELDPGVVWQRLPTAAEIETGYNAQVAAVSGGEIAAGTETAVRRWAPADVKAAVEAHAPEGGAGTVTSVNTVEPDGSGDVVIDADDIAETATRKWAGESGAQVNRTTSEIISDINATGTHTVITDAEIVLLGEALTTIGELEAAVDPAAIVTAVNATGTHTILDDTAVAAIGTVKTVNGESPDGSGAVVISVGSGAVDSVNGVLPDGGGNIELDADDIDDTSTTNKFASAGQLTKIDSVETGATADQTGGEMVTAVNATGTHTILTDSAVAAIGTVKTVNGESPDGSGAVTISVGGGSGYGTALVYDTFAAAEADTVGGSETLIVLLGYAVKGDCPPTRYVKVATEPTAHTGYLTSADGYFFELEEEKVTPIMFGAKADLREYAGVASIATGDATLTSSSNIFTADDVGKHVLVAGASYHHEGHRTTVASYTAADEVELTDAATYITADAGTHTGYTGYSVSGHDLAIGTDDSAAVHACLAYCAAKGRVMHTGPHIYFIATPENFLDSNDSFVTAPAGTTKFGIVGDGKYSSGFFYSDGIRYLTLSSFFSPEGLQRLTAKNFMYRGSWNYHKHEVPHHSSYPSGTQPTYVEQVNGQFSIARQCWEVEFEDLLLEDVRGQGTWTRGCSSLRFKNVTLRRVAGGGLIATEADNLSYDGCSFFDVTDDSIMVAGRFDPANSGTTGSRAITPIQVSVRNTDFFNSGMIKINHPRVAVIEGCTGMMMRRGFVWIRGEEDINVKSGGATIVFNGCAVGDLLDVSEMPLIEGSLGIYVYIDAKTQEDSGTNEILGDGDGADLYDGWFNWIVQTDANSPSGPIANLIVSDCVFGRTLHALTNWSDLDVRTYDALNRALSVMPSKEDYLMDPAISEDALRPLGLRIQGPRIRNMLVTDTIFAGVGTGIYFGDTAVTAPVLISEAVISNVLIWDAEIGIRFFSIDNKMVNARIEGGRIDLDPLRLRTGRQANGSWSAASDAPAIVDGLTAGTFRSGVEFVGMTFANCSEITDGTTDIDRYVFDRCVVEADISAVGFSTSNKGVGRIPAGSPAFRVIDMDLDPTSGTFLQVPNKKELVTATLPSSGAVRVVGERTGIEGTVRAGGLVLLHHQQRTTGTGVTLGTDVASVAGIDVATQFTQIPGGVAITIADDASTSFTVPTGVGWLITCPADPTCTWFGLLIASTAPTPFAAALAGSNIEITTGALTGTTGSDTKMTISMATSTFHVENRRGAARTVHFTALGGTGFTL